MITSYRRNCMGTVSFVAKFPGMRKPQEFIVYPMREDKGAALIQSDTRMGAIEFATGEVCMSNPRPNGAHMHDLMRDRNVIGKLDAAELLVFKAQIASTSGAAVGSRGVTCDNSAAINAIQPKE